LLSKLIFNQWEKLVARKRAEAERSRAEHIERERLKDLEEAIAKQKADRVMSKQSSMKDELAKEGYEL
jgi:nicotinate-nucleotide pyrophosphorylase